ncbi:MAG: histidinol dehydrogenase [Synergistaceae bacterium]|nr:histidinol dehydrogenase [Synergistaceae bacterium]MBR0220558.1 histidinol dehydrogenase [Synergistaceae bacterium]
MIKILKLDEANKIKIFERAVNYENNINLHDAVANIINDVKARGDDALRDYELKFDKVNLENLEVTRDEMSEALNLVEPEFLEILKRAANNIKDFHARQVRNNFIVDKADGVILGQRIIPLEKVGLYIPGGTAAYPSSVLMNAIPAKLAGVEQIIMTTPPMSNGKVNPNILAAALVVGVNKIYKLGGAQAIAALAFGTESVVKVDKITGPGNMYVAEAKRQVFGHVAIDMIAGPSEILVIADANNKASWLAADLLSQAEHDVNASAVLITSSENLAREVQQEIEAQLDKLERHEIARASIENNGKIILVNNLDRAVEIANEIAPEHLELCVDEPFNWLGKIKNAGSVFLGRYCPEALGDYYAGPNHTLPTSGTARFSSPLSVDDFVKKSQFIYYTQQAMSKAAQDVADFAYKEGLTGHAASALSRGVNNEL